jgi:cytochrome c-type biogenesis protein CcmH
MNAVRLPHSKRHPGKDRAPLFRVLYGCPVDSGFRRNDDFFLFKRFGERFGNHDIRPIVWFLLITSLLLLSAAPAHAVRPDEMLTDPALEARARDIGRELRCLVCRNQSIDDSDADLAHDLRVLVRERLQAGDTNAQVVAYIRSRYGDFVLLRPPLALGTVLLWAGPGLILLLGVFGVTRFYRTRARDPGPAPAALSSDEQRRLKAVLGEEP